MDKNTNFRKIYLLNVYRMTSTCNQKIKMYNDEIDAIENGVKRILESKLEIANNNLKSLINRRESSEKEFNRNVNKYQRRPVKELNELALKVEQAKKLANSTEDKVKKNNRDGIKSGALLLIELRKQKDAVTLAEDKFKKIKSSSLKSTVEDYESLKHINNRIEELDEKISKLNQEINNIKELIQKEEDKIAKKKELIREHEMMKQKEVQKEIKKPLVKSPKKKTVKSAPTKKKCPKGSNLNKKTGRCNKNKPKNKSKRSRCPNGSRKNPKTGNCEKK
tara:strand:- start:2018 stop:2851 length:834 start_codon:yes stop_codon:yes gene_type:complete